MNEFWLAMLCLTAVTLGVLVWVSFGARRADWGGRWLNFFDGVVRVYRRYYHGLNRVELELPVQGPALVVANHLCGLDPLIMIAVSPRPLRFLIAREQYQRPVLNRIFKSVGCIPVDRDSNPERAFREALRQLKAGEVVALFPQGGIQLKPTANQKLKKGVIKLAQMADCPIYAIHIDGISRVVRGHIILPVLLPSRVRAHCHPGLNCGELSMDRCMAQLQSRILS